MRLPVLSNPFQIVLRLLNRTVDDCTVGVRQHVQQIDLVL